MHAYTGSVYRSYALSFSPAGVGYDPRGYLWISDPDHSIIWQCTTTGSAINSFSVSRYGAPTGCGCDGTYVYAGIFRDPSFWVMKFETSPVGIAPASLGKVKAMFR